ncbi:MAG: histidinol-phosphatase [Acetobacterales bacterium]
MTEACPVDLIDAAVVLADISAAITLKWFRADPEVALKADSTPVSAADREAERAMRDEITRRFPAHGILGEEFGDERTDAEYVWALDPIDGTKSFVTGRPLFGTLVALARAGRPLLGIVDLPAIGDRWIGAAGHRTTLRGKAARTRRCAGLDGALLSATSPGMFSGPDRSAFERLQAAVLYTVWGSDCFAYGQVASGWLDLVVEASLDTHDFMAIAPVVTGAGGVMTDWEGRPLTLESGGRVVASGDAALHRKVLAALAG